jgi:hypothetical protein
MKNQILDENRCAFAPFGRRATPLAGACCWTLSILTVSGPAHAAEPVASYARLFDPYAGVVVEHDSNLFAVGPGFVVDDPHGVPRLADTLTTYRVGTEFNYLFDLQHLYATLEGRKVDYDHFTNLDHSEYLVNIGLAWKLTSRFDGVFDARREKKIIAFGDADVSNLQIQTDQVIKATFNVAVTPEWRLESQASLHTLDYPVAGSPDYRLQEEIEGVGIKYVGIANLAYGIEALHVDGRYLGVVDAAGFEQNADYKQNTYQFALKYKIQQVTQVNAAIGYTDRSIAGSSTSVSGVTGQLGYTRQLTGKTSVYVQFQRLINSYVTAGSSEIDVGGLVGAYWQATPKLGVAVNYSHVRSNFEGETLVNALTLGRKDNSSFSTIEVKYQPLRWLTVRPYIKRQVRESSLEQFTYNDTMVGIELLAKRDAVPR